MPVLVGHHRRHSPLIVAGQGNHRLGPARPDHRRARLLLVPQARRLLRRAAAPGGPRPGGGVVLINLIHVIDDLRNLCGDIAAVQAVASNAARGFAVEDTVGIILTFRNGAIGTLKVSDAAAAPWSWELTSGENKAYPRADEACYFMAGMRGVAFCSAPGVLAPRRRAELVVADARGAGRGARPGPVHPGVARRSADQRDAPLLRRGAR